MNTIYVFVNSEKVHPRCHKSEAFFYPPNEHTLLSIILLRYMGGKIFSCQKRRVGF